MAATVSGQKTSTADLSPTHTAANLNTVWAIAPENLTYTNLLFLLQCTQLVAGGEEPTKVLGTLF